MRLIQTARTLATRLRTLTTEGKALLLSGSSLTKQERDGVLLVVALFVFGLAVQWLRWLLR